MRLLAMSIAFNVWADLPWWTNMIAVICWWMDVWFAENRLPRRIAEEITLSVARLSRVARGGDLPVEHGSRKEEE